MKELVSSAWRVKEDLIEQIPYDLDLEGWLGIRIWILRREWKACEVGITCYAETWESTGISQVICSFCLESEMVNEQEREM